MTSTQANLRLHASLSGLFKRLTPRIVMTTYEGDASERLIWNAARCGSGRPLCVGYQHTRLLRRAHAIRRSVNIPGLDCDPDAILTLGAIPQSTLASSPDLGNVRLITYGSHRRLAPASYPPFETRQRVCLVLPDADDRECCILFGFAVACARQDTETSFVLRPHPAMNFTALASRHSVLRELPPNVTVSTGTELAQDCGSARYCLYRGSSAAMHAAMAGIKPFYLARPCELSFDPLFELRAWRETINSPAEFTLRAHAADLALEHDAARQAAEFYERYVSPVRPAAIDELLEMAAR
jgi:hypothetical protein